MVMFTPGARLGHLAVAVLGNGTGLSAQDTVPFALWCAAQHLTDYEADYEAALWLTVSGLGDRDTTCAIVACAVGAEGIRSAWLQAREPLPNWRR